MLDIIHDTLVSIKSVPPLRLAVKIYSEMATFQSAGISDRAESCCVLPQPELFLYPIFIS